MATFSTSAWIDASKDKVWDTLADLGGIYKWNPGVSSSHSTSESSSGEGATRHCDLQTPGGKNMGYLEEKAFDWREGEGFKIDVYETNMPLKNNVVSFTVKADGEGTRVAVSPDYAIKYGPLGAIADLLFVRRQMKKGMDGLLAGLKYYVETGNEVGVSVPDTEPR